MSSSAVSTSTTPRYAFLPVFQPFADLIFCGGFSRRPILDPTTRPRDPFKESISAISERQRAHAACSDCAASGRYVAMK